MPGIAATPSTEAQAQADNLRLQAQRIEAEAVAREREQIREEFRQAFADRAWYTGIRQDDQVKPYQFDGMIFGTLAGRWLCGDSPGLGKTREAIGWLDMVEAKKVIIVCEAPVANQFAAEVEEYSDRTVRVLSKRTPARRAEIMSEVWDADEAVLVVNYEIWRRDKNLLQSMVMWQADTVVVDEAHNLKHTSTANYTYVEALIALDNKCPRCGHALFGLMAPKKDHEKRKEVPCPECGWRRSHKLNHLPHGFARWQATRSVENVMLLTGTPLLNSPLDIYPLLHLISPILFPSQADFCRTYCLQNIHSGKWEFTEYGARRLREKIAGYYLARTAEQVGLDVPKPRPRIVALDLDRKEYPKQWRTVRQISDAAQIVLETGESATLMHLLSIITRKRQANVYPGGIQIKDPMGNILLDVGKEVRESVKLDAIVDHAEILHEEGHRQIVFSQFRSGLVELERRFTERGIRAIRLDGDTTKTMADQIKKDFYRPEGKPRWDVLLANYRSGGTGLNLIGADRVHILDEEWSPGKREQSYHRVARIGQKNDVEIYVYRLRGTIDTWLANILYRKEKMLTQFGKHAPTTAIEELTTGKLLDAMKNGDIL